MRHEVKKDAQPFDKHLPFLKLYFKWAYILKKHFSRTCVLRSVRFFSTAHLVEGWYRKTFKPCILLPYFLVNEI